MHVDPNRQKNAQRTYSSIAQFNNIKSFSYIPGKLIYLSPTNPLKRMVRLFDMGKTGVLLSES